MWQKCPGSDLIRTRKMALHTEAPWGPFLWRFAHKNGHSEGTPAASRKPPSPRPLPLVHGLKRRARWKVDPLCVQSCGFPLKLVLGILRAEESRQTLHKSDGSDCRQGGLRSPENFGEGASGTGPEWHGC